MPSRRTGLREGTADVAAGGTPARLPFSLKSALVSVVRCMPVFSEKRHKDQRRRRCPYCFHSCAVTMWKPEAAPSRGESRRIFSIRSGRQAQTEGCPQADPERRPARHGEQGRKVSEDAPQALSLIQWCAWVHVRSSGGKALPHRCPDGRQGSHT